MDKNRLKDKESANGRIVPISTKIIDLVRNRYNPKTKRLIEIDGKPVTYYEYKKYIFEPVMEQLGMNHTIHETRHTGATLLGNITDPPIDDLTKKYIMGHKTNTDITDRYTHKTIQQLIDAVDRM